MALGGYVPYDDSGVVTPTATTFVGSGTERTPNQLSLDITSGTQSANSFGLDVTHTTSGASTLAAGNHWAGNFSNDYSSTGTAGNARGVGADVSIGVVANGTITEANPIYGYYSHAGTGTVSTAHVGYLEAALFNIGTTTTLNLLTLEFTDATAGAHTVSNLRGLNIPAISFASGTDNYGVSIGSISGASGNNYALRTSLGTVLFGDKVAFTQTDFNEYIDSEADGYLDYSVTTAHRFRMSAADTDVRVEFIGTTNSGLLEWMEDEDYFRFGDSVLMNSAGIVEAQGTDIASASTIVLPTDGNTFELTGTTAVNLITTTGYQDGHQITLVANESVTINNGTATSGADVTIRLNGAGNYAMTAEDTLTLVLCTTTANGQAWREVARSVN